VLFGSMEKRLASFKVDANHAFGYDDAGSEAVKVPLTEPMIVREFFDKQLHVFRHNTP
jgi:hypothetical protein